MEILKRGEDPKEKKYDGKCMNCKTEVRFAASEAAESMDRNIGLLSVCCPVCKHSIVVTQ
jgi:hypothetical protein